jgi:hypothetical protein
MPAEISYFFIVPRNDLSKLKGKDIVPFVLTYTNDIPLQVIMEKYLADSGYSHPNATRYFFCLASNIRL